MLPLKIKFKDMKKIFRFFMASFAVTTIQAQDINDAMRYAQDNQTGTARFSAILSI